jgi:hypothetical protein
MMDGGRPEWYSASVESGMRRGPPIREKSTGRDGRRPSRLEIVTSRTKQQRLKKSEGPYGHWGGTRGQVYKNDDAKGVITPYTLRQCPISPGEWGAATPGSGRSSAATREGRMEEKQGVKAPHACPLFHVYASCECGRGDDALPDKPIRRRPLSVGACAGSARPLPSRSSMQSKAVPFPSLPRFIRVESRAQRKSGGGPSTAWCFPSQPAPVWGHPGELIQAR